ncbi:MAG: LytTR family transcriptional regulator DNA-binding domain-containing protein [Cetobacterium sp.]|uniref:LytTR family transcriptional regulator DNA-binding domain-containing protein n=1 Tax=Cetobacterium sp. TaxID=2071632 RepID=UPI003F3B21E3
MNKIGLVIDNDSKILLKEILNYDFIETNIVECCKLVLLDISIVNFKDEFDFYLSHGISIIVLLGNSNIKEMRTLLKSNKCFDCILRYDVYEIEKSIEEYYSSKKKYSEFYLGDTYLKGFFNFSETLYMDYCRISRKIRFNLIDNEVFFVKRTFSDLDFLTIEFPNFYKLERGLIINTSLIKILDYKEERIIFKDKSILYISKVKIKELENICNFEQSRLIFKNA